MKMNKIGKYPFLAEPFRCGIMGNLLYSHLGNYMLNAADYQATERKFGYLDLRKDNKAWVLSRFVIEMMDMPKSYDKFFISTWVESTMKYFTHRNWQVEDEDGKVVGYGSGMWAMIDLNTRQPADISSVGDGVVDSYADPEHTIPIAPPSRVRLDEKGAQLIREIGVTYSDLDVNGHVNSVRYIEHAVDLFPVEWYMKKVISRLEVAYVAEAHYGEKLRFYQDEQSADVHCFKITSLSTSGEEKEVVRVKFVFTDL